MGSGKSSLGKKLAKKLGYEFLDTDREIELIQGKTIAEMFEQEGESYFRQAEREMLIGLKSKQNCVIATGGGLPCFGNNMGILNDLGHTIYLQLSPYELTKRILNSKTVRPLAQHKSEDELLSFIKDLLKHREVFYTQAKMKIKGRGQRMKDLMPLLESMNLV